jgi:hypothetical protein
MQTQLNVISYCENTDTFACSADQGNGSFDTTLPGWALSHLTGECGEPSEFLGRVFELSFTPV